jgi:glyoxylase-like metal-dependent hydrolase (beta-lactamase superfamily II)/8-oxo-dGTP pyrophosphatase MutT (NUDIX family)
METPVVRPAATLVILRQGHAGPEALLTTRSKSLRFMGGAAVFPGGAMAPDDRDPRWVGASTRSAAEAAAALSLDDPHEALGAFVCAVRETFEEVGLLLAEGPSDRISRADAEEPGRFLARCLENGVRLRTDLLMPAGRWVTPQGAPVRFDARFFVTRAPARWVPEPDDREVDRCWWTTPAGALVDLSAGRLLMAPPTIEMLQRLDGHATIDDIEDSLRETPVGSDGIISVRLSPLVHVVLAPNPGHMTGPGTNTYIVGSEPSVIIDPAVDDEAYLDALLAVSPQPTSILITHRHSDHVGGVRALVDRCGCPVRAFGDSPAGGVDVEPLADGDTIDLVRARLSVLHTPGHSSDHVSFHLASAASLFAGDNILGEGTAVIAPPDGSMRDYLASLERLRALEIDRIYPGHFRPLDGGSAVIDGYIQHRRLRRDAVVEAIRAGHETVPEIVAVVYQDTPPHLHPVAAFQVEAMLEMLLEDGAVERREERWIVGAVE